MLGDGRVGDVGQAQLAEEAALLFLGQVAARGDGQEAIERQLQRLFAQHLGLQRFADQRGAGAQHGDLDALQIRIAEQPLLGVGALAAQAAALADGERHAELGFHQPGDGEIEVIAAQQQMLADGGAREVDQIALARDADQAEVAGAAAHVADQHDLAIEKQLAGLRQVVGDPGIEGGGGLFEQRQLGQAGLFGGHHGELAGFLVEGGGHGEDDILIGQRKLLDLIPGFAEGGDVARETSTGESTRPVSGESQGRILAVRSTSGLESQDLAECTSLVGTSAPCSRA
jgi:hypothetical protein